MKLASILHRKAWKRRKFGKKKRWKWSNWDFWRSRGRCSREPGGVWRAKSQCCRWLRWRTLPPHGSTSLNRLSSLLQHWRLSDCWWSVESSGYFLLSLFGFSVGFKIRPSIRGSNFSCWIGLFLPNGPWPGTHDFLFLCFGINNFASDVIFNFFNIWKLQWFLYLIFQDYYLRFLKH